MKRTFRWTIISSYAGLIVAFAAIILLSSTLSSRRVLLGHARDIMTNIASYTVDKASHYLLPARDAARLTRGLARSNILSQADTAVMETYFYQQLFIYPQFSGIYFGTMDGDFIMASRYNKYQEGGFFSKTIAHKDGARTTELVYRNDRFQPTERRFDPADTYDPRTRPWFQQARMNGGLIWTAPYVFFTSQQPGITTANPVYDREGLLRGVVGVDIALDELSTFLSQLKVGQHGLAFIMNTAGDVVAYPDMTKIRMPVGDKFRLTTIDELDDPVARKAFGTIAPTDGTPFHLTKAVFTSFDQGGQTYHAMFAPFSGLDWPWVIGIYLPENDYLGTLKDNSLFNLGISVVAVLLGGLLGLGMARKLDQARRQAEAADAAKSHFLARVSHEIRTPMKALLDASALLRETDLTPQQKEYLNLFRNAGTVLRDLVNDVLDFSTVEAGKVTLTSAPFSLRVALDETCSVLAIGAHEKGLDFRCNVAPATPDALEGDVARIKQVLVNLIANAIKFTDKGSVEINAEPLGADADEAIIAFSVRDTGVGIPGDRQDAVFESFPLAAEDYGLTDGSGLGLAICRHLVGLMGGRLEVSSEQGKGSTFRCILPLRLAPAAVRAVSVGTRVTTSRRGLRILVVEDDESSRMVLDMFIKSAGHLPMQAATGQEALELLITMPFDLVLWDAELPDMDGLEALRRLRAQEAGRPAVPVAALTSQEDQNEAFLEAGFAACLTKPVRKGDVLALLERCPPLKPA